jgi:MFS family permease
VNPPDTSFAPFAWLRELTRSERRTCTAAVGGWALDAMDVQIYSFVIPTLIMVWGITRADAGAIATGALLSSAVGGWLGGWMSDRFGRVRTLQISILWFAFFTLVSGLARNPTELLWARTLMGLGFGGEWAAGSVLLGETMRAQHRGKALGFMQSGWALGWASAAILNAIIFSIWPPEFAWRALFFVGITPAILVFFLRRLVSEPEVYLESRRHLVLQGAGRPSVLEIFRPPLLKVTLLGGLVGTGAQGGYNAISTWLPTYLKTERHLSILDSTGYLIVLIAGTFCGYVAGGYISDWLGRRRAFLAFGISAGIVILAYTKLPISNGAMLVLGFPLGFAAAGVFSGMGAFYTEQFPTRVRGIGQGFAYNLGRAVGALFPALVGSLSGRMGLGGAIGAFAFGAYALMAVAAFLLPETRGKALES